MKLTPRQIEFFVYLLGVALLGLAQAPVRRQLGDGWAFAVVIAYLLGLRALGVLLARLVSRGQCE